MVTAKIIVTVSYHPLSTLEHAEEDKAEFLAEVRQKYWPNVSNSDIHIDYTVAEVEEEPITVREPTHSQPPTADQQPKHNHFGEIWLPDTCPGCKWRQDHKDT